VPMWILQKIEKTMCAFVKYLSLVMFKNLIFCPSYGRPA